MMLTDRRFITRFLLVLIAGVAASGCAKPARLPPDDPPVMSMPACVEVTVVCGPDIPRPCLIRDLTVDWAGRRTAPPDAERVRKALEDAIEKALEEEAGRREVGTDRKRRSE